MKKIGVVLAFVLALGGSGSALAGGKAVTQKYEVVCLKCVAHNASMGKDGGHGASHAACAMKCATNGTDLGLMDSKGNLYIPIRSSFQPARDAIKDKAGQTVELTGTVIKTKGVNYLQLADSGDKAQAAQKGDGDKD